jgi:hypothetical protein
MGATAVTTAILRTEAIAVTTVMLPTGVIDPGRGRGGATAMVTAVSGAAGHRRMPTDTNGPDMDMRNRRDRRRRFGAAATTKPFRRPGPNIAGTITS